ncbi:YggT family protein [Desulfoscipio gibsoniae]|uniref:Putative integral membrane protein n=1 Tax=Desulfoscipio gibsoniae DSM 7213 TaxID=767817 RepID=R4KTK2_9FIRM|nr:YggT family protein [Desulfoscipio gibsoniae]AGL02941.1 putative integral membrane protein [Desulfoscipio gibsoniae DSM 7213]
MDIGVTTIIYYAIEVYTWLIFIRIILSWIRVNPYQPVVRFIYETTEPFLGFFRRLIPPMGMIDFSPIVAFIALQLLATILIRLLHSIGIY